jgi:hypothetical protein
MQYSQYRPFASAREHGRAFVELTRLMMARLAFSRGAEPGVPRATTPISAKEIAAKIAGSSSELELRARAEALEAPIEQGHATIRARAEATRATGVRLPFAELERALGLDEIEARLLGALFALELDGDLARAITALGDDLTRRRPEVGLVTALVGGVDDDRLEAAHRAMGPAGALRRQRVLVFGQGDQPHATRPVRLSDRVVDHLRGQARLDELLAGYAQIACPGQPEALVVEPAIRAQLERALGHPRARFVLTGPDAVGKTFTCSALLGRTYRTIIHANLTALLTDPDPFGDRLAALFRELVLHEGAALVLDAGSAGEHLDAAMAARLVPHLESARGPVVVTSTRKLTSLATAVPGLIELAVPLPSFRDRIALWRAALADDRLSGEGLDLELVAGRYALGAGGIHRAAERAVAAALLRDPVAPTLTQSDLGDAARQMFSSRLGTFAQRIPTSFRWSDLVLPEEPRQQLLEVARFARLRPHLLETWGFASKLPYGRGLSVILAGPPGTGKTMVAQILANELGYDLYRIDLSQIVNKYIGETEKNLARIFDEAETSHAVLFFDEADSLFAKRTDVKSSNDRYANLEVNFLLQRMETYDGVTLLATNLEQGLDPAFKRRVRFSVQFDLPEAADRERLWKSMFPAETPLDASIDWEALAAGFELTGGYIKRAALRAALAASHDRHRAIRQDDLLAAARQEYRDMGRIA